MAVHGIESRFQDMTLKAKTVVVDGTTISGAEIGPLDGATAGTATAGKAMVTDSLNGVTGYRDTRVRSLFLLNAPAAVNATATITAAQLTNGLITSTTAAAVVGTLPTGTDTQTALNTFNSPGIQTSDAFRFYIVNTGPNAFTLATATGWTDGGNGFTAVAAGTSATFLARRTGANTFALYRVS